MEKHYYNTNLDDKFNHEVHTETCSYLPRIENRELIGYFSNCHEAIRYAKVMTGKNNFDGCFWCCRECHKG